MLTHSPKAVVITGASTGIGAACALSLARRGHRVFAGVRREQDGKRLQEQAGDNLFPVLLDVESDASIAAARRQVEAALGDAGLDGLVNNAGIAVSGPIECIPFDEFRRQFDINVFGVLAVTQAFLPFIRHARGRIVMMSSISGRITGPFLGPYSSSKFALEAMSDALRLELSPWNIAVSVIEPGPIATPIWDKARAALKRSNTSVDENCQRLYGARLRQMDEMAAYTSQTAIPCDAVVTAVEDALFGTRPRIRYVIGRQARMAALMNRFIPDRLRDRLILKSYGMTGKDR